MTRQAHAQGHNAEGCTPALAVDITTAVLVIVAVLSVVLLILIIVAPWRQVGGTADDKVVEAKLLLHRNPDEPAGEIPRGQRGPDPTTATTSRAAI